MTSSESLRKRPLKLFEAARNRLLDRSRRAHVDYAIAFLIGVTPVMLAPVVGVESSLAYGDGFYHGYHHRINWMSFCVILPAILFAFRWITSRIGWQSSSHAERPPIVGLMQGCKTSPETTIEEELTDVFKENVFGTNSFAAATLVTILISILDARVVGLAYRCASMRSGWSPAEVEAECAIVEKGWSTMFLTGTAGFYSNLLFVFVAYLVQACAILMGIWLLVIMCRHNWYFMKCIYRRTRDGDDVGGVGDAVIVLAVDDPETCFGFRPAFRAFNTQVTALLAGGLVMLVSRYLNVGAAHTNAIENAIETLMEAPGNLGILVTLGQTENTNLCDLCGQERHTRYSWAGRRVRIQEQIRTGTGTGTGTVNFGTGRKQTMRTLNNVVVVVLAFVLASFVSVGSDTDDGLLSFDSFVVPAHAEEGVQGRCNVSLVSHRVNPESNQWWRLHTVWDVSTNDRSSVSWHYGFHYRYITERGERDARTEEEYNRFESRTIGRNERERVRVSTQFAASYGARAVSVYDVDVFTDNITCTGIF